MVTHRKNSCLFLLCGRHFQILWIVYPIGGLYSISKLCLCSYCMYCSVSYWEKHQRKGVSLLTISAQVAHIPICSLSSIFYLVGLYHSHSFSVQQLFQFLIKKSAKMATLQPCSSAYPSNLSIMTSSMDIFLAAAQMASGSASPASFLIRSAASSALEQADSDYLKFFM